MDTLLTNEIATLVITGIPNFVGFVVLAAFCWKVINRQHDTIDRMVSHYLDLLDTMQPAQLAQLYDPERNHVPARSEMAAPRMNKP